MNLAMPTMGIVRTTIFSIDVGSPPVTAAANPARPRAACGFGLGGWKVAEAGVRLALGAPVFGKPPDEDPSGIAVVTWESPNHVGVV